jgi:hypothetical protein
MSFPESPPRSRAVVPSLLALVVLLSFLPSLANGFVNWDDPMNLRDNPEYRGLGLEQLRWMWSTNLMGHFQPLAWMTLGLDYVIWGMNPTGYHLSSLLFHAAGTLLLFLVISSLLRRRWPQIEPWPAFAGALLYGIHPLRVESVVWATERRDVVCGFFALLAVFCYLKRADEEREGRPSGRWLVLSCAAFAASLLSKALSIMLPFVLLILDLYPLGRFTRASARRLILEKLPYFLLCFADGLFMIRAMRHINALQPVSGYSIPERVAQASYGLCFYLWKTICPVGLIPLQRIDVPLNPLEPRFIVSMLAVVATTAILWGTRRRFPAGLATWLCYGLLLFPVMGLIVTGSQLVADRYSYLALIPVSVLASAGLKRLLESRPAASRLVVVSAGGLLVLLSALTLKQTLVWRDSMSLWTHELEWDPVCSLGYNSRAEARMELGDWPGVVEDTTLAIRYGGKGSPHPFRQRGLARARLGDVDGALRDFDVLVELTPKSPDGYWKRGVARLQKGNVEASINDLSAALDLGGPKPELLFARGVAKARGGNVRGAAEDFDEALRSAPPDWPQRREVEELRAKARGS